MVKKNITTIIIVSIFSAIVLSSTGIGIWLGVRNNSGHPNTDWELIISGNIVDGDYNITMSDILKMPSTEDEYLINRKPEVNYTATFKGVSISHLINNEIDIDPTAENITFIAFDGYFWTYSIDLLKNNDTYMLAYMQDGKYIDSYTNDGDGFLFLISPMTSPTDYNAQRCVKSIVEIRFD